MSPVHGTPNGTIGVILVKEMVFAIKIDHPIGIVHPFRRWREMDLRTVQFRVSNDSLVVCLFLWRWLSAGRKHNSKNKD